MHSHHAPKFAAVLWYEIDDEIIGRYKPRKSSLRSSLSLDSINNFFVLSGTVPLAWKKSNITLVQETWIILVISPNFTHSHYGQDSELRSSFLIN